MPVNVVKLLSPRGAYWNFKREYFCSYGVYGLCSVDTRKQALHRLAINYKLHLALFYIISPLYMTMLYMSATKLASVFHSARENPATPTSDGLSFALAAHQQASPFPRTAIRNTTNTNCRRWRRTFVYYACASNVNSRHHTRTIRCHRSNTVACSLSHTHTHEHAFWWWLASKRIAAVYIP